MLCRLLYNARQSLINIEKDILFLFGRRYPPDGLCLAGLENPVEQDRIPKKSVYLEELLKDSILWAVPKKRRTVEKRLNRKFGIPDQVWKPLVPKKNLLICRNCGSDYVAGHLCSSCYSRVKKETEEMHKEIEADLGLNPIEKDVVVLYQGEKEGLPDEYYKGKRIIEMKKERPPWFSKNLLERTTKAPATTTSVKPTDLA